MSPSHDAANLSSPPFSLPITFDSLVRFTNVSQDAPSQGRRDLEVRQSKTTTVEGDLNVLDPDPISSRGGIDGLDCFIMEGNQCIDAADVKVRKSIKEYLAHTLTEMNA